MPASKITLVDNRKVSATFKSRFQIFVMFVDISCVFWMLTNTSYNNKIPNQNKIISFAHIFIPSEQYWVATSGGATGWTVGYDCLCLRWNNEKTRTWAKTKAPWRANRVCQESGRSKNRKRESRRRIENLAREDWGREESRGSKIRGVGERKIEESGRG